MKDEKVKSQFLYSLYIPFIPNSEVIFSSFFNLHVQFQNEIEVKVTWRIILWQAVQLFLDLEIIIDYIKETLCQNEYCFINSRSEEQRKLNIRDLILVKFLQFKSSRPV